MEQTNNKTKNSYDFRSYYCATAEDVQKIFDALKDQRGFYPYYIPQAKGVILVIATINEDVEKERQKPKIFQGLKPLTEDEARQDLNEQLGGYFSASYILLWASRLYERGFQICKKIDIKEGEHEPE